jgi:hypothetical protein
MNSSSVLSLASSSADAVSMMCPIHSSRSADQCSKRVPPRCADEQPRCSRTSLHTLRLVPLQDFRALVEVGDQFLVAHLRDLLVIIPRLSEFVTSDQRSN